jgi:uroporphyrinogen decarboxylase
MDATPSSAAGAELNTRERFNKVMHWQQPDRVPNMDFGYWAETITTWHGQGLPDRLKTNEDVEKHLGLEGESRIPTLPIAPVLYPPFEIEVLEEEGDHKIIRSEEGNICRVSDRYTSIPQYIKFGLETREDWARYKPERLDYKREDRIGDVGRAAGEAHNLGLPVRIIAGSLYGLLRNWMGVENISIALLTDRDWVEEMMEHLTEMALHLIDKALPGLDVDMAWWWEDMCYNKGPLLSPKLFSELMVPRYKRITEALRRHGVDVNVLDCDGCIYELVPGWIEAGINCMFPIEVAHTDPIRLRRDYGKDLLLMGGVDKIALAGGRTAIDREMDRLKSLVEEGGYIPTVDHRVPPDVSFANYLYYLEKKSEIL